MDYESIGTFTTKEYIIYNVLYKTFYNFTNIVIRYDSYNYLLVEFEINPNLNKIFIYKHIFNKKIIMQLSWNC